jgi:MFS-type transporter involved in bile tolerance (Atg22 family)
VSLGCIFGVLADALLLQEKINPFFSTIAIGAAFGIAMPAIYSLPAFLASGDEVGLAYGLYQLLASLGIVAQWLFGRTIDITGAHVTAYTLMMIFFGAGLVCALAISRLKASRSVSLA